MQQQNIDRESDIMNMITPSLIDQFHSLVFSVLKVIVSIGESLRSWLRQSINNTRLKAANENILYTLNEQIF